MDYFIDRFTPCPTTVCLTPGTDASESDPGGTPGYQRAVRDHVDPAGNLYVADSVNQRIQPFPAPTASPDANAGAPAAGESDQAGFNWPRDITYGTGSYPGSRDTKNNRLLQFPLPTHRRRAARST